MYIRDGCLCVKDVCLRETEIKRVHKEWMSVCERCVSERDRDKEST